MDNNSEIWKDIIGYEGLYQISTFGRVRSLDKTVRTGLVVYRNGKPFTERLIKGRLLRLSMSGKYYRVGLTKNFRHRTIRVHQLVAITFLNHKPCGHDIVVDHIDNNKLNNNLANLRLVTQRENLSRGRGCSRYVGVSKSHNKWRACIYYNGINRRIGTFNTEDEANEAYQLELSKL